MSRSYSEKAIVENGKMYFNPPLDENKNPYWIPIVVKNRDYLLGYIHGYNFISEMTGTTLKEMHISISSDRFNDILSDGSRIQNLSRVELKEKIRNFYNNSEHPDNADDILEDHLLSLSCSCGIYYTFDGKDEIPEKDTCCSTCNKSIIEYTHRDDDCFEYDGEQGDVEAIIKELNDENKK